MEEIDATRDLVGFRANGFHDSGWVCWEGGMTCLMDLQVHLA